MNDPKEKTYTVLWGMCTATYYVVKAKDEDEAVDRSGYNYDPDEEWAVETYNNGIKSLNYSQLIPLLLLQSNELERKIEELKNNN